MKYITLHIVCFDIPYPVSHGGFYDLYYKLQALKGAGVVIILHCFEYGRSQQPELNKWCSEVHYYKRKTGIAGLSLFLPYIVSSRIHSLLLQKLSADNHPILLEGTHTTYLLLKKLFPKRNILYRLHNIEHIYYRQLFAWEKKCYKKLYYGWESWLLKQYEKRAAAQASVVLSVSQKDREQFKQYCPEARTEYLPPFLPFKEVGSKTGKGNYLLYHGNLSIAENEQAALWLLKATAPVRIAFIIAGKNPSKRLAKAVAANRSVSLIANPSDVEMERLIQEAHIHLIYSFNATGIKIKLLHALFLGRHCIINAAATITAEIDACCFRADDRQSLQQQIINLKEVPFTTDDKKRREAILLRHFDNELNAQQLIKHLQ